MNWRIFFLGFLILFFELTCIRWFSAHVVHLQFFTNIVLVAAFLGVSLGCLNSRRPTVWLNRFPKLLLLTMALAILSHSLIVSQNIIQLDTANKLSSEVIFFGTETPRIDLEHIFIPVEVYAGVFFALIVLLFVGPGQLLGEAFDKMPDRLQAYRWNIGGSIVGVLTFATLSFLSSPAIVWFALSLALLLLLLPRGFYQTIDFCYLAAGLIVALVSSFSFSNEIEISWSPYYVVRFNSNLRSIEVNTTSHQGLREVNDGAAAYSLIHLLNRDLGKTPFSNVLVIGSGSGNDLAHALYHNVGHIDAVEIDPAIQKIGAKNHPNLPYSDARVSVHVTDGRQFMQQAADSSYDLVVFALVDSVVLHSGFSNLRLESLMFTSESFKEAQRILKPNGQLIVYNVFRYDWLTDRITRMLEKAFGARPLTIALPYEKTLDPDGPPRPGTTVFIAGATGEIEGALSKNDGAWYSLYLKDNENHNGLVSPAPLASSGWQKISPATFQNSQRPHYEATDDWPFLYLRAPGIPFRPYLTGVLVILSISAAIFFLVCRPAELTFYPSMSLFGAGFLLLETKAVVQLAVLFGGTWVTNTAVFVTVLAIAWLGNYLVSLRSFSLKGIYITLVALLALSLVLNPSSFLGVSDPWRTLLPAALVLLPLLPAGMLFSLQFRSVKRVEQALASNLAGSILGGLTEYCSMIVGFRGLTLIAGVFYLLTAVLKERTIGGDT